jgi:hypothetical protein
MTSAKGSGSCLAANRDCALRGAQVAVSWGSGADMILGDVIGCMYSIQCECGFGRCNNSQPDPFLSTQTLALKECLRHRAHAA